MDESPAGHPPFAATRPAAIRVCDLSKSFDQTISLGEARPDVLGRVVARALGFNVSMSARDKIFTVSTSGMVLENLSLDIAAGSVVGLLGASGSGKSVLLSLLAGVVAPTAGRIEIHGRVASLLDHRGGFPEDRTMRENVEDFCRVQRLTGAGVDEFYEKVVDFADLRKFQDMQLRQFSTGMAMRFNVAMALMSAPDILLLDDVLEVGDLGFQLKCVEFIRRLGESGMTAVVAMNDEELLSQAADRMIGLRQGKVVSDESRSTGAVPTASRNVVNRFAWHLSTALPENDFLRVELVAPEIFTFAGIPHLRLTISCTVKAKQILRPLVDWRSGRDPVMRTLFPRPVAFDGESPATFSVEMPLSILAPGLFTADLGFLTMVDDHHHSLKTRGLLTLEVTSEAQSEPELGKTGLVSPDLRWEITSGGKRAAG